MIMKDGIVRLIDLPQEEVYARISELFRSKLSILRDKRFKNTKDMAKAIGESESVITSFFLGKSSSSLKLIKKLADFFEIKDYDKEIVWIGGRTRGCGIANPKIPFNFNTREGGMFIASVLGDGTFSHNFEVGYINYCPLLLRRVKRTANKLFGKVRIAAEDNTSVTFPVIVGRVLKVLGMSQGRKTVTNPSIPEFITNGSEECRIGFLKQITDDEASPQINPPNSYSIRYEFALEIPIDKFHERERYIPNLLRDTYNLVRSMGYSTTRMYGGRILKGKVKPRYTVSWAFDIQGKSSLERFAKEINFRNPERREKLEYGISRMKINTYGRKAQIVTISKIRELCNKNDFVTKHELAAEINRTKRNAQEWLIKLNKRGFVRQIGGNEFIGSGFCSLNGRTPAKYIITESGLKFLNNDLGQDEDNVRILPKYR